MSRPKSFKFFVEIKVIKQKKDLQVKHIYISN